MHYFNTETLYFARNFLEIISELPDFMAADTNIMPASFAEWHFCRQQDQIYTTPPSCLQKWISAVKYQ